MVIRACPTCGATEWMRDPETTTPNSLNDDWYCVNGHLQTWTVIKQEAR
jgi:hypothetical protein